MALKNIHELNKAINQLRNRYQSIKNIDAILNKNEQKAAKQWFQKWNAFYIEYQDQENKINEPTLKNLNNKFEQQKKIIDAYLKADKLIEQQKNQPEPEPEPESQSIEPVSTTPVTLQDFGTANFDQLTKSWDSLINLWDRIEILPEQNVVNTVNKSINAWLDFSADKIEYYRTLGQPLPSDVVSQLPKWVDRYNKTKKVVESAASQSKVLKSIPKAQRQLTADEIRLSPGEVIDPTTGIVTAPEILIKGLSRPKTVEPGQLPPPWIPPPEPPYVPPPTIIIKQSYPPVEPVEPSIDPEQSLIFEPSNPSYASTGSGLTESVSDVFSENPFEQIDKRSSSWPWLVGFSVVLFLSKTWRK